MSTSVSPSASAMHSIFKSYFTLDHRKESKLQREKHPRVELSETSTRSISSQPLPLTSENESEPATSLKPSNRSSLYPIGDFRNASSNELNEIKCDVMVNWLHSQQEEKQWISSELGEGVILKKARGEYICYPRELENEQDGLFKAIQILNVRVSLGSINH